MEIFVSSYSTEQSCQLFLFITLADGSCTGGAGLRRDPRGWFTDSNTTCRH